MSDHDGQPHQIGFAQLQGDEFFAKGRIAPGRGYLFEGNAVLIEREDEQYYYIFQCDGCDYLQIPKSRVTLVEPSELDNIAAWYLDAWEALQYHDAYFRPVQQLMQTLRWAESAAPVYAQ